MHVPGVLSPPGEVTRDVYAYWKNTGYKRLRSIHPSQSPVFMHLLVPVFISASVTPDTARAGDTEVSRGGTIGPG